VGKVLFILAFSALTVPCSANVIYVDEDAPHGGDGTMWEGAYRFLQDALREPNLANGWQIWVAAGVYKPDSSQADPNGNGSRYATFQLVNGVGLYGGFTGGENSLEERDWQRNETILSGDLLGDDGPGQGNNNDENSYHVVVGSGTDASAVFDGFTITAGCADGMGALKNGGGMYNSTGSPTVKNCTFRDNSATYGGGMYNSYSNPRLTNCRFSANIAQRSGGGTYNSGAGPILTNCILSVNSAENGGGVHNSNSNSRITNCTFTGNSAVSSTGDGGAVYNWLGKPVVTNCTFSANAANDHGGGIYCGDFSNTEIRNCIFCDNSAAVGPEIALNDDPCFPPSVTVSCCDVGGGQGGVGGWGLLNWEPGNIEADPLFVDPNGPDGIVGTGDEDLRLSENSPCIDAGNNSVVETNSTDLDGNPRILDGDKDGNSVVDMGAYEFNITCCGADLNGDGLVNYVDFAVLAGQWLEEVGVLSADIAPDCGDGKVAIEDILILAANWLAITGETNLAGYWPMDDDANNTTVADSVGGNNGTAQQNTSDISITGMIDGALSFNGIDDYIQIADSEPLSPTDEVTVCGWFWFNDASENVGLIHSNLFNIAFRSRLEFHSRSI